MENDSSLLVPAAAIVITILTLFASLSYIARFLVRRGDGNKKQARGATKMAPEAGGSWPILGHLHLLGGPRPTHFVLADMADRYGPMFAIRLGSHRAVVVSTGDVAKECLTTHDQAVAGRPKSVSSEVLGFNYAVFALGPYGPYWRQIRKMATLELLSNHRIGLLREVRESEVLASVRDLLEECRRDNICTTSAPMTGEATSVRVDMKRWFWGITLNVMVRMVVGRRFSDEGENCERTKKTITDFIKLLGKPAVGDVLPFLRWLDLGGQERAMRRAKEKLDQVFQRWLDEHKTKRKVDGEAGETNTGQDFMAVMLSTLDENEKIHGYSPDTVNKASCLVSLLGPK